MAARPARTQGVAGPRPGVALVLVAAVLTALVVLTVSLTNVSTHDGGTRSPGASDDGSATGEAEDTARAAVTAAAGPVDGALPGPGVVGVPAPRPSAVAPTGAGSGSGSGPSEGSKERARAGTACDVGSVAGPAQVIVVRSSGTRATVQACSRTDGGDYVGHLGPYPGYVGRSGVTSAGSKREGDGATPAGVYPLRAGFGLEGDPGLAQGWDRVDSSDVWVDDPDSALYNTQQRLPVDGRWSSAEALANAPAYRYAQVIGYNESATPGRGSAIFLHVSTGGPTAGCVSVPSSALLALMRWQRSGAVISIR